MRIVVIGTSGAGKTTLARELARRLGVTHIEIDALHWEANWTATPADRLRAKVQAALNAAEDGWSCDGNYSTVRELIWSRADLIVWLDYSMTITFTRVFRRTLSRWWNGEVLWNGNREQLWMHFLHRDSLLLWVITTWRRRRRDYPKLLRSHQCARKILRFREPAQTQQWLQSIATHQARSFPC